MVTRIVLLEAAVDYALVWLCGGTSGQVWGEGGANDGASLLLANLPLFC